MIMQTDRQAMAPHRRESSVSHVASMNPPWVGSEGMRTTVHSTQEWKGEASTHTQQSSVEELQSPWMLGSASTTGKLGATVMLAAVTFVTESSPAAQTLPATADDRGIFCVFVWEFGIYAPL
jgi:hypothetical protein